MDHIIGERGTRMTNPVQVESELCKGDERSKSSDEMVFFSAWLRAPLTTAVMLPSGGDLSRALAAAVDPSIPGAVVELGAGTGPVSAALVERGIAPDRLILIELNPTVCALLQERYPTAHVVAGDAFAAPSIIEKLRVRPLAAVVSCLPLYGKSPKWRQQLLLDLLHLGAPGIPFVQATYCPRSPIPIDHSNMVASASPRIWRNLFPAVVWTYRLRAR